MQYSLQAPFCSLGFRVNVLHYYVVSTESNNHIKFLPLIVEELEISFTLFSFYWLTKIELERNNKIFSGSLIARKVLAHYGMP